MYSVQYSYSARRVDTTAGEHRMHRRDPGIRMMGGKASSYHTYSRANKHRAPVSPPSTRPDSHFLCTTCDNSRAVCSIMLGLRTARVPDSFVMLGTRLLIVPEQVLHDPEPTKEKKMRQNVDRWLPSTEPPACKGADRTNRPSANPSRRDCHVLWRARTNRSLPQLSGLVHQASRSSQGRK